VYAGVTTAGVLASSDAGATWTPLGVSAIGTVADVALSRDEGVLFAATSSGVWRMFVRGALSPALRSVSLARRRLTDRGPPEVAACRRRSTRREEAPGPSL